MPDPHDDPRIYFAAERTFLAWLRTGLGLIGIGFAVSRFGLFLQQGTPAHRAGSRSIGASTIAGIGLVLLGVLVNVGAVWQHIRVIRELRSGAWTPGVARGAVALAVLLAGCGTALAVLLLVLR